MNSLDQKFRKNKISVSELKELRENVNSMSDVELEELLTNSWFNEKIDISSIQDERIDIIKSKIDKEIGNYKKKRPSLLNFTRSAAAVLLIALVSSTLYLYFENRQLASEELIVSTGKNERANITLPDGTIVALNSNSELGYKPKNYNKDERKIRFDGEGYFQVYKDLERTFFIDGKGMQVKVLGTKFNLKVRESDSKAELSLEEGSISLLSTRTNESVILKPYQKAILDQLTGKIIVIDDKNIMDLSAWKTGSIVFRNTSLEDIISVIEENYNVKITCKDCLDDTFTGTIPIADINETITIIEKAYNLKSTIKGREIYLSPLK